MIGDKLPDYKKCSCPHCKAHGWWRTFERRMVRVFNKKRAKEEIKEALCKCEERK